MRAGAGLALLLIAGCATGRHPSAIAPATVSNSASADGLPLGTLPRQDLSPGECGIFLWKAGENARLLLAATANPPVARIMLDGHIVDLPRIDGKGAGVVSGPDPSARYGDGRITLALDLVIEARRGLTDGAAVPSGVLRLDRADGESIVMPVVGLLACR